MNNLNPEQIEAVTYVQGPILVLAGAGTGKTTVLVERVKHLIEHNHCTSDQILATTFTVKATEEMRVRLQSNNIQVPEWIGTFHGLCSKIVRANASACGLDSSFTLIEGEQQKQICKTLFGQKADEILEQINCWKNNCQKPEDVPAYHEHLLAYKQYQKILKQENQLDFGDLLMECCLLWSKNADILEQYQKQFVYICIDEFQDTNAAQFLWLKLLTSGQDRPNLFCVGDDDQAIYTWRGSDNKYILNFHHTYPNAKIVKLRANYRSTSNILNAALSIVERNRQRLGKVLISNKGDGEKIQIKGFSSDLQESQWLMSALVKEGGSVGILVRTMWQVTEINNMLKAQGIIANVGLKILYAYLEFFHNPTPALFAKILHAPKKGITPRMIEKCLSILSLQQNFSQELFPTEQVSDEQLEHNNKHEIIAKMLEVLENVCDKEPQKSAVELFCKHIKQWQEMLGYLPQLVTSIWKILQLGEQMPLKALQDAQKYTTLGAFLDNSMRCTISVMTIHAAKGLEFDSVYLLGWEENVFPHARSLILSDLESERRLAYVAVTRGRDRVFITYSMVRKSPRGYLRKGPSRFIQDIPYNVCTMS